MATETFRVKGGARQLVWLAPVVCFVCSIASCAIAYPVSQQAGDMSPAAAMCVMIILSILMFGGGIYFIYSAYVTGRSILTLSDEGVNLNNRWIAKWGDIESVDEEDIDIEAKGVKVTTEHRLWIKYIDQQERKATKFAIPSSFEGYEYIKERIMNNVAASKGAKGA